ncbi:MAG: M1 family aminopeptidase [Acidobacteriota bacterium]
MRLVPVLTVLVSLASAAEARQTSASTENDRSIQALLAEVEMALTTANGETWAALLAPIADRDASMQFFDSMVPDGITRAAVRERERGPLLGSLPGEGFVVVADVFTEAGPRGRISTWRLDIRRPRDSTDAQPWRVAAAEMLSVVDGLHRLALDATLAYVVRDLSLKSVDFELRLPSGQVFVAPTDQGVTALVLLGNGTMAFAPGPAEERGQVRIFGGSETIDTAFSAAYVRLSPFEFDYQVKGQLTRSGTPNARDLRRAQGVFEDELAKSFSLDLRDLSRDTWSLLPQPGDFLAEVRTRRHGTLTFARATAEAEDVTLFHRQRQRNIAVYASPSKLSSRGRFYNEDDLVDYDVLHYDIDASFSPDRDWLDGRTRLTLRIKSFALAALTLRLAEDLTVRSITSAELGRLMFLRVRNQNNIVVNLPNPLPRDTELTLTVQYAGRLSAQATDQETVGAQAGRGEPQPRLDELPMVPAERNWLLSNRTNWYPQNTVSDYASAVLRLTVPAEFAVVATGVADPASPFASGTDAMYGFTVTQPVRYLSAIISRFTRVDGVTVALDIPAPEEIASTDGQDSFPAIGSRNTIGLVVQANRRQQGRGRDMVDVAAEILRLYSSLIGDVPYDSMTLAMVEHDRPGGHSPGYFAVLNNPPPITTFVFRNDPAMFTNFPEFYVAHELAHQWWGQAVGWKNYHEQWLSEGFAQYFAALYGQQRRGEGTFRDILKQFRRWAMEQSDQGAVHLGYRLGHIKGESRVFRALVYNKGASVLHMLRRLVGDDAFFDGLRRYYRDNRYKKAGTADLRRAMEAAAGRGLDRFFERWIYESGLPRVQYSTTVSNNDLVVNFSQLGEVYDVPVTVTLTYADRTVDEVVVVNDARVEKRIPLTGSLQGVSVNDDHGALGRFDRR